MQKGRWVTVDKSTVYQGDSGVTEFSFTLDKFYNSVELSALNGYLKLTFPDDSGDVLPLEKRVDGDKLIFKWLVEGKSTQVDGEVTCQILLEKADNTVVFNSQVFKIEIEKSVNNTIFCQGGRTSVEVLLETINDKIERVDELLNTNIVKSVNNLSGDVVLDAESVGAITSENLTAEIDKIKNGEYLCKKAERDGAGNDISDTYVKNVRLKDFEWKEVAVVPFSADRTLEIDLGDKYRELFIYCTLDQSQSSTPVTVNARLEERRSGYNSLIFKTTQGNISLYSTTNYVVFKLTMFGIYAKVDCAISNLSAGTTAEVSNLTNVGKSMVYPYIENVRIVFHDQNDNEVFCRLGSVKIYGIKYLD